MSASLSDELQRVDTWLQTNLESPGASLSASPRPRSPRSDGEGLFDTFDGTFDAQWGGWEGTDRAPALTKLRPPTPLAERAVAAPQSQTDLWGSLLGLVAPRPARAAAEGTSSTPQPSETVLEHAATVVQRLMRGKIARLNIAEIERRLKLLELYARAEEHAAIVIQRSERQRQFHLLTQAAVRMQAVGRGRLARLHPPPKRVSVSGAYCGPSTDESTALDLRALRGPVFKRSRGWPRYQLRYMYMRVDAAGEAALCHRASDSVGGGTGVEKQLPVASITAVHVESWGRYVFSVHSRDHGVNSRRRFRCRTYEELVRWSNALSLAVCPPPVSAE